jgi:hypothetical protein
MRGGACSSAGATLPSGRTVNVAFTTTMTTSCPVGATAGTSMADQGVLLTNDTGAGRSVSAMWSRNQLFDPRRCFVSPLEFARGP